MGFFSVKGANVREILPGARQRVLCGREGKIMMTWYEFDSGTELPVHSHLHEQVGIIVSGEAMFTVGTEQRLVKDGDGWQIPPNVPHGVRFRRDTAVIETFHPPREDFLR
ncbi:MAG: cupin domain-containing protein [Euryarchaeota archaeon]|nr:cupin domain-containing protein [Euryarchaeota archaeon]